MDEAGKLLEKLMFLCAPWDVVSVSRREGRRRPRSWLGDDQFGDKGSCRRLGSQHLYYARRSKVLSKGGFLPMLNAAG